MFPFRIRKFGKSSFHKPLAPPECKMFECFEDFYGFSDDEEFQDLAEDVKKDINMIVRICGDTNCEGVDLDILGEIFDKKRIDPRFQDLKFYNLATEKDNINALKFLFSVENNLMIEELITMSFEWESFNCLKYLVETFDIDVSKYEKHIEPGLFASAKNFLEEHKDVRHPFNVEWSIIKTFK